MKLVRAPKASVLQRTPRSRRVLVICGDTQVGLWTVRSLARSGLKVFCVGRQPDSLAFHSRYSSGAWTLEGQFEEGWMIDQIEGLARELEVGSVMAIAERYHLAMIRHRHRFEPDIHVFSPPAEPFERATDKGYVHELCQSLGIPVAQGTTLDKLIEGRAAHSYRFPMVLRSRRQTDAGAESGAPWKAAYAEDDQQLQAIYQQVRALADNVLVQEYHPGVEDHVQVLMHNGKPVMHGEYIGEHHMPLAGGVTVQRVSCRHEPVIRDALRLLEALHWDGIAGVQFHYDPKTDRYIFLEINPRFIGGLPTVIMAGFDAPYLLWQSHFEPERMRPGTYRLGTRTRILGGDANWLLGMLRGDPMPPGEKHVKPLSAVAQFLWHCGPWTKDDVYALTDIKPLLVDWRHMIRNLRHRVKTFDILGQNEPTPGARP